MNENEYTNTAAEQDEKAAQTPVQNTDNTVPEADPSACLDASEENPSDAFEKTVREALEKDRTDAEIPTDSENNSNKEGESYEKQLEERISVMQARLDSICSQIEGQQKRLEKAMSEYNEFFGLYPDTDIKGIPDSVWKSVDSGVPLAAAYALCERKKQLERQTAESINERNRTMSSGPIGSIAPQTYLSPSEVRSMSSSEVRANLSLITESMKHWQ